MVWKFGFILELVSVYEIFGVNSTKTENELQRHEVNTTQIDVVQNLVDFHPPIFVIHGKDDEIEIPGWEKGKSRDPTEYVNPINDTVILPGNEICAGADDVHLVIMVTSAPDEYKIRADIRETWASDLPKNMRLGFFLGLANSIENQEGVFKESLDFKDIVQEDIVDSYNNLTLKSISMLKWFIRHCAVVGFLMKVDTNTYVSVRRLEYVLEGIVNDTGILLGDKDQGEPHRNETSKWYVPRYMYVNNTYPKYLRGNGYMMSRDVVEKLYKAALTTQILYLEDVFITGVCAEIAGVTPKNLPGMIRGCPWKMTNVTCHPASPHVLRRLWYFDSGKRSRSSIFRNTNGVSSAYRTVVSRRNLTAPFEMTPKRRLITILRPKRVIPRLSASHQTLRRSGTANTLIGLAVVIKYFDTL